MTLRIAVNLLHAPAQLTGTGRYAREMVQALAALPEHPEIIGIASPENRQSFRLDPMPRNLRLVQWGRPWPGVAARRIEEWLWLEGYLRELKPDVFWGPSNFLPLMLFGRVCPTVVTLHDMTFFRFPDSVSRLRGAYWRGWKRRTIRVADRIVTATRTAAEEIALFGGVNPDSIPVIPHGVDARFFAAEADAGHALEKAFPFLPRHYALYVGTLTHHKNLPALIRSLARMRAMPGCGDAALVLAGKHGDGYDRIARAIHENSLEKAVFELGFVEERLLPALYAHARLAVLPSLNEGFGLPIIEAMAAGAPVLTSQSGAMAEVAADAALLVDVADEEAMADAMARAWSDESLRGTLREKGRERAREFTWEASAGALYKILEEVAESN